jgi:hypothetical protein
MKIKADKITNILGIIGAILIIQQTYWPELLPKEHVAPVLACIVGTFGMVSNKRKIVISFNDHDHDEINKVEDEIERKWQEIEELLERLEKVPRRNKNEH